MGAGCQTSLHLGEQSGIFLKYLRPQAVRQLRNRAARPTPPATPSRSQRPNCRTTAREVVADTGKMLWHKPIVSVSETQQVRKEVVMPIVAGGLCAEQTQQASLEFLKERPIDAGMRTKRQLRAERSAPLVEQMRGTLLARIFAKRFRVNPGDVIGFEGIFDRHLPVGVIMRIPGQRRCQSEPNTAIA